MQEIEERIPLTPEEIRVLGLSKENNRAWSGCICFLVFIVAGIYTLITLGNSYISMAVAASSLLYVIYTLVTKPSVNEDVVADLEGGYKLRIVAPIEEKLIGNVNQNASYGNEFQKSSAVPQYNYYMTIKNWTFKITEHEYLAGPRKGDFMEFIILPNTRRILSAPVRAHEEKSVENQPDSHLPSGFTNT